MTDSPSTPSGSRHSRLKFLVLVLGLGLREGGFSYLLFLRMMPMIPFNWLNYGSGLTDIRFRDFVLATAIGIVPGTFIYCYTATSLANAPQAKGPLLLAFSLMGLMALAPLAYRKWRGRNGL